MLARGPSFRTRLLLGFLLVIAITLVLPTWYSRWRVSQNLLDEAKQNAVRQAEFLAHLLQEGGAPDTNQSLDTWLTAAATKLNVRLTYISSTGDSLGESASGIAPPGNGAAPVTLPEDVQLARKDDAGAVVRTSPQSGITSIHVSVAVRPNTTANDTPGTTLQPGILRLTTPFAPVHDRQQQMLGELLLGAVLALLLAIPFSIYMARQLSESIRSLVEVARAIGSGDYARRIRLIPGAEFKPLALSINSMAENIMVQIQTIITQKEQLEAVLNGMKEGVMVLDENGRISAVNTSLSTLFGLGDVIGRRPLEAILDPALQRTADEVLATLAGERAAATPADPENPADLSDTTGGPRIRNIQIEPDPGRIYEVGFVPLREGSRDIRCVAVFHDISELKRLERVRRDFVANVSHELRTPLTSIKGYAETLAGDERLAAGPAKTFLDVIVKNANHMTKILGDLLSLSRLEAGKQAMDFAPVDPAELADAAFRECVTVAQKAEVELANEIEPEKFIVKGDFDRLVQVFRNLIENGVRYSPTGASIRVFATQARQGTADKDRPMLAIGVSDLGPGIPREDRKRIFERFYRVEKHRGQATDGSSGLGLAIAKHIVDRHAGSIVVESPARGEDTGTTFVVTLPLLTPQEAFELERKQAQRARANDI